MFNKVVEKMMLHIMSGQMKSLAQESEKQDSTGKKDKWKRLLLWKFREEFP